MIRHLDLPQQQASGFSRLGTKKYRFISVELDKNNTKLSITYLIEGTSEQIREISNALFEL
jgi:hypothetical protein